MTEQNKTTTIPLPVQGKDMDSIMQSLESGVEELFTSNRYQEFLKTMAKFHNYSFNNTMLIAMQRPDATLVTSYKNWQSMGRQVMKGEKGITIISPAPYKKMKEKEVLDENQRPIMGTDGKPKTETLMLCAIEVMPTGLGKGKLTENIKNKNEFYHWLPDNSLFTGGIINFRRVVTISTEKFFDVYEGQEIKVQDTFVKNIMNRFSAYYARQGQPDFLFDKEIEKRKSSN